MKTRYNLGIIQVKAPIQYFAAYSATLSVIACGMHSGWTSPSLPKLIQENSTISVSNDEGSWMAVMPLLGNPVGSLIAASGIDVLGRKRSILLSSFPHFTAWIMIAFAQSVAVLYTARFIAGVGDGLVFTAVPLYIGEIADPKVRGLLSASILIGWALGILFVNIIGSYLTISTAALVSSILPVVFLLSFVWMPESPYYHVMKGNQAEATKSLQTFRAVKEVETELKRISDAVEEQMQNTGKYLDLFTVESNRKAVYIVIILNVAQQVSGAIAITFYAQHIFSEAGSGISSDATTTIYFSVQLISTMISSSIVDRAGRRPLLIVSIIGSVVCLTIEATYFYFKSSTNFDLSSLSFIPVVALIFFVMSYSLGLQTIPVLMLGELFPANVKAFASFLADFFYSILGTIVSKFFQIMKDSFGMSVPFFTFALCSLLGLGAILIFVPETKGKTLEDIQIDFKKNSQEHKAQRRESMVDSKMKV